MQIETLSQYVTRKTREHKWNLSAIAEEVGVTYPVLYGIASGRTKTLGADLCEKLANYFRKAGE
jgi:hypothetical protein